MSTKKTHLSFSKEQEATSLATPIGQLGLQFDKGELVAVKFIKEKTARPAGVLSQKTLSTIKRIEAYFDSHQPLLHIPLRFLRGTPFQQRVWQALRTIPFGQTLTYGDLAQQLGTGPRAIGAACRTNPLPLVIPCHRVVAANGLGGFAGKSESMLKIKKWLLAHEGNVTC